jgi:hypothetical protein
MRYWDLRALINGMFSDFAASGEHIRGIALVGCVNVDRAVVNGNKWCFETFFAGWNRDSSAIDGLGT